MNRQRKMNRQSQWLFEAPFVDLTPSPVSNKPMLRRGSRGTAVVELQNLLTQKGFRLQADGIFGSNTDTTVRNFQRNRGLSVDGIVGQNTWTALLGSSRTLVPYLPSPVVPSTGQVRFIWPVEGRISSPFGPRINPVTGEFQSLHNGIDLAAPTGTPVRAAASGIVTSVVPNDSISGNYVIIQHNGHNTQYLHLNRYNVQKSQKVSQGDLIGEVGATGRVTGPHLHFIVKYQNEAIDPETVLPPR